MELQTIGRLLIFIGLGAVVLGVLLLIVGRVPFLNSLGNLPGDIRIEREGFTFYFPCVSMILISIILSIVLNIALRFINRS